MSRRGSFAVVKEGLHKESGLRVAIKIVDKKDAVFDAESLEQEVRSASQHIPNTFPLQPRQQQQGGCGYPLSETPRALRASLQRGRRLISRAKPGERGPSGD